MSCHLVKSADSQLRGLEHIELRRPLILLRRPPRNLHSPGDDKSMKDVYEDKLETVVQPEDSIGCHIKSHTDQGQNGNVCNKEQPREQIDEVFLEGYQIPSVVAYPGHLSSLMSSTQITSHLFSKVIIVFRQISCLEKEVDVGHVGEGWESDGYNEVLPHVLIISKGMADRGG